MVELQKLSVGYGHRVLICDAECELRDGRLVALIGRNGAGKSTLLRVLAGIDRPLGGRVLVDGKDVDKMTASERATAIAFVTTQRVRIAHLRCRDVVGLGRAPYTDWAGRLADNDKEAVVRALEMVGMSAYADRTMDKMSDGECQRVMIARALAQDTPTIMLDEPTSFLDLPNRYELCALLRNLAHESGKCVIFSTHELDIAVSLCDDIALVDSPQLLFGSVGEVVDSGAIQRLFSSSKVDIDPLRFIAGRSLK